jgi:hypothetical protein
MWIKLFAVVGVVFGLMTVVSGGTVLFGGAEARKLAGDYVPFVVWFNFIAGFFYVAAGAGLWRGSAWAVRLSFAIAVATLIVFGLFGVHVLGGGAYETRTVIALTVRSGLWFVIAFVANRGLPR